MTNILFKQWRARSPWYDETHEELAASLRGFFAREAVPHIMDWEAKGSIPREFHKKAGDAGILGLGFPEEYGGISEGHDQFHNLVKIEEIAATGSGGLMMGLLTHTVALPPVIDLGCPELRDRVVPEVIAGDKILALAITEPSGGSDVAALTTTAVRDGDHYVVNGQKTYITNGMRADYLLTAVRTGGAGMGGLSILLIEADSTGVDRTPLQKMGLHSSDTATIYFDHVKVPVTHLIGPENEGFRQVMAGFNVERLGVAQQCTGFSRVCLDEAARYAGERETFGKTIGSHQLVRAQLADLTRQIDATQAMTELCAWRFQKGQATPAELALLKVQATLTFDNVAKGAVTILGGSGFMQGPASERLYREVRALAIGGGTEDILRDLAGRQLGYGSWYGTR
ncbi:acyl-CoA dehydrogenase family protein [Nocardia sp. NPDC004278]